MVGGSIPATLPVRQQKVGNFRGVFEDKVARAEEISDRMAVLIAGRLAQVATPAEVRSQPADEGAQAFFAD